MDPDMAKIWVRHTNTENYIQPSLSNNTINIVQLFLLLPSPQPLLWICFLLQFNSWDKWPFGKTLLHDIPLLRTANRSKNKHLRNQVAQLAYDRRWHIWHTVADLTFEKVQCSQDQRPESSIFLLELLDLDVVPLPLPPLPLLLPPPKLFALTVLLQAPWESTSDRPFSRARTRFSK